LPRIPRRGLYSEWFVKTLRYFPFIWLIAGYRTSCYHVVSSWLVMWYWNATDDHFLYQSSTLIPSILRVVYAQNTKKNYRWRTMNFSEGAIYFQEYLLHILELDNLRSTGTNVIRRR
jgi:hypothetical protein